MSLDSWEAQKLRPVSPIKTRGLRLLTQLPGNVTSLLLLDTNTLLAITTQGSWTITLPCTPHESVRIARLLPDKDTLCSLIQ